MANPLDLDSLSVNSIKDVNNIFLDLDYEPLINMPPLKYKSLNEKLSITGLKSSQVIYSVRIMK
tara:strand:- start:622 stop:813 length:192 start_codon:yes stop_codon:yes gene_type:complete